MRLRAVCGESSMHGSAGEVSGGNTGIDSNLGQSQRWKNPGWRPIYKQSIRRAYRRPSVHHSRLLLSGPRTQEIQ